MGTENSKTDVTVYLDSRSFSKRNNGHPIKFRVYHKGQEKHVKTGYYVNTQHWIFGNHEHPEVVEALSKGRIAYVSSKLPNSSRINKGMNKKADAIELFMSKNEGTYTSLNCEELKTTLQKVADELDPYINPNNLLKKNSTLKEAFKTVIDSKGEGEKWGTSDTYDQSLNTFIKYFKHLGIKDIRLVEITKDWVESFDDWHSKQPGRGSKFVKASTRAKRVTQLKKVLEAACDDPKEIMDWSNYQLRKYSIAINKPPKRSIDFKKLDHEELAKKFDMSKVANLMDLIRQLKLIHESKRWHYRNMLLFMWNCRGMDLVDISFLTNSRIYNKTLEYSRTKLGQKEEIAIIDLNEEALEILELYDYKNLRPGELIFPFMKDRYNELEGKTEKVYRQYRDRVRYFNRGITKLLQSLGLDEVTSKMIRHTWAQDGYRKFETREVISEGLLHGSEQTSRIYARDLDRERIDEVNKAITERKSSITTIKDELQIDLFQYFHKGKTWKVEMEEFQRRILKKINGYENQLKEILSPSQFKSWSKLLQKFANSIFQSFDQLEDWINLNLKAKFEKQAGIRIITSDYNL